MSTEYDNYISSHRNSVQHAYDYIINKFSTKTITDILPDFNLEICNTKIGLHDSSKECLEEYDAYDAYFYGDKNDPKVKENFDKAWLHHIHYNPHHWQHWVLIYDDPEDGHTFKALDMDDNYILEMICDWWSFSWKLYTDNDDSSYLHDVFKWYDSHRDGIIFSPSTKEKVEKFLNLLKKDLDEFEPGEHNAMFGKRIVRDPLGNNYICATYEALEKLGIN